MNQFGLFGTRPGEVIAMFIGTAINSMWLMSIHHLLNCPWKRRSLARHCQISCLMHSAPFGHVYCRFWQTDRLTLSSRRDLTLQMACLEGLLSIVLLKGRFTELS